WPGHGRPPLPARKAERCLKSMSFYTVPNYLTLPRAPQTWIVKDVLPASGLLNIYGPPKGGKTYAAIGMAIAISNGEPDWMGFRVMTPGPVAFLEADTPRSLLTDEYFAPIAEKYNVCGLWVTDQQLIPYPFNILGRTAQN